MVDPTLVPSPNTDPTMVYPPRGNFTDYLPIYAASYADGMGVPWGAISPLAQSEDPYDYNKAVTGWQSGLRSAIEDTYGGTGEEETIAQEYGRAAGLGSDLAAQFIEGRDPRSIRSWLRNTWRYKNIQPDTRNQINDVFNEMERGRAQVNQQNQSINRYVPLMLALQARGVDTLPMVDAISTMQRQAQARPEVERMRERLASMRLSGKYSVGLDPTVKYSGTTVYKNWLAAKGGDERARDWMIEKGFLRRPVLSEERGGPMGLQGPRTGRGGTSMTLAEWKAEAARQEDASRRDWRHALFVL
jgi:hypothetical protein